MNFPFNYLLLFFLLNLFIDENFSNMLLITKEKPMNNKFREKPNISTKVREGESEPVFKYTELKGTDRYPYIYSVFVEPHNLLLMLCVPEINKTVNASELYSSRDMGENIDILNVAYDNQAATIDKIYAHNGIVVLVDGKNNVAFTSNDGAKTFNKYKFPNELRGIRIHPTIESHLAAIDVIDNLYISSNNGLSWNVVTNFVRSFAWSYTSTIYYLIKETVSSASRKDLYKGNSLSSDQIVEVFTNCTEIASTEDIVYAILSENSIISLMISHKDKEFKKAIFPKYLKPTSFKVHESTAEEIFVVVQNSTTNPILYGALILDLKFVKILENVGFNKGEYWDMCTNVEFFESLPGMIISLMQSKQEFPRNLYTVISYTHGSKWSHVLSIRNKERACDWPSCFLKLHLGCATGKNPITMVEKSPNILLAKGVLVYNSSSTTTTSLFISTDAGYSWYMGISGDPEYTILDHGGIIVSIPFVSNDLYYSYDTGISWKYHQFPNKKIYSLKIIHSKKGVSTVAVAIGFEEISQNFVVIKADFTNVFKNNCKEADYDLFTPGQNQRDKCFQGQNNQFYKRKQDAVCMSILDKLQNFNSTICPCTADDFGCAFNYYMENNACVQDPDGQINEMIKNCTKGEFYETPSNIAKLHGDVCKPTKEFIDEKNDICLYTDFEDLVTYRTGNVIKYVTLKDGINLSSAALPIPLLKKVSINKFAIDYQKNCLYFMVSETINKTCWGTREEASQSESIQFEKVDYGLNIVFDEYGRNLYIAKKQEIYIINVDTKYRRTIIKDISSVEDIYIFPSLGYIIYLFTKQTSGVMTLLLSFNYMSGTEIKTFKLDKIPSAIMIHPLEGCIYNYYDEKMCKINIITSATTCETAEYQGIISAVYESGEKRFVTKNSIIYGDKRLFNFNINAGIFHLTSQHVLNPCILSTCTYFCIPLGDKKYQCGCPDTMIPDGINDCKCGDSFPNCKECKAQEFHCKNGMCIDINARCNGIKDCEDGSDEENCKIICRHDEFICPDNTTCLNFLKKCDGVKDCPDGFDELDCTIEVKCKDTEFKCRNNKCIDLSKYCDGVDDCGDFSDEESCSRAKCLPIDFRCKSGECIIRAKVCNKVFDCTDWSDEIGCGGSSGDVKDPKCVIICDNKCIPMEKMCDHITDCINGEDEIECNHTVYCNNDSELQCESSFYCYKKSQKCDNFRDCPDGSDEFNCPVIDKCSLAFHFTCQDKTCIDMNNYCDGVSQCPDGTDETETCKNSPLIELLSIKEIQLNSITVNWIAINLSKTTNFRIMVAIWESSNIILNKKTNLTSFNIENLEECGRYFISVVIDESNLGRSLQYYSRISYFSTPINLTYDSVKNRISWTFSTIECLPSVYYIECLTGLSSKYRNFTKSKSMDFLPNDITSCKISVCPSNVYNISCTDFSQPIQISHKSANSNFYKYGVPIIFIILITIFMTLVILILKRKGYLKRINSYIRRSLKFNNFNLVAFPSESTHLVDIADDFKEVEINFA